MTRQEAYEYLKDYLDSVFHNSNDYETYCYLRDCADTLAQPDPDPITGLVPCGCGGKASEYFVEHPYVDKGSYVECGWCCINVVGVNKQDARERWNRAMGWKGGAE